MMKRKAILSLLLAAALAFSAPPFAAAAYEAFEHPDVPYTEMPLRGVDVDGVETFCARFTADPIGQYEALLALYDEIYTQRELAYLRMCENPADDVTRAASERASDDYSRAEDAIFSAVSDALAGPKGQALAALMPEGEADAFWGYTPSDDADFAELEEENALVQAYYSLPYDGSFAANAAEIYLRLAAMRRDRAERAGYDSYADYAYSALHAREYGAADAKALERVVRQELAPLYVRCALALDRRDMPWDDGDVPTDAEILDALRAHMGSVSGELTEALDYLCRNALYRIGGEPMYNAGFTTLLPAYRAPFLYNYTDTRFGAFSDTVHEFGHFNAAYHDPTPALYQYVATDVWELQSQALELLFIPSLQDILAGADEDARAYVALYAVTQMLSAVVDGCLYDEFEQAVYADPDITAEGLDALEQSLYSAYGLDALYGDTPFWCEITQLFEQPFYYISYAVSALPALDVWLLSRADYAAAADVYLRVSEARTDAWFLDVLYDNDLCDVTDPAEVRRLIDGLRGQLDPLIDRQDHTPVYLAASLVAALLAVGAGAYLIRRKRR